MAVLGTFVDRVANAFTLAGPTCQTAQPIFQTVPHSLGASPDYIIPILASYSEVGASVFHTIPGNAKIGGMRGNASLNTVFANIATGATINATFSVDVVAVNVWSGCR